MSSSCDPTEMTEAIGVNPPCASMASASGSASGSGSGSGSGDGLEGAVRGLRDRLVGVLDAGLADVVKLAAKGGGGWCDADSGELERVRVELDRAEVALKESSGRCGVLESEVVALKGRVMELEADRDRWIARSSTHESALAVARSEADCAVREAKLGVENARLEAERLHRDATRDLVEKVGSLQAEVESKKALIDVLQKQAERPRVQLPGEQGTAGEQEIEEVLTRCLGPFMVVRNVSKVGQGHELDLELQSRDGLISIRIDVKNSRGSLLPEGEIARFYRDVDGLKPAATACILFQRPGLRNKGGSNVEKGKRGGTWVYQIGWWAVDLLIETIHEIVVDARANHLAKVRSEAPFAGAAEVSAAVGGLCRLVSFQNEQAARAGAAISEWKTVGAERNRAVADQLRAAHGANSSAVPRDVLAAFEAGVPKRARGRPPAADLKKEDKKDDAAQAKAGPSKAGQAKGGQAKAGVKRKSAGGGGKKGEADGEKARKRQKKADE